MGRPKQYINLGYVIAIVAIVVPITAMAADEAPTWGNAEGLTEPQLDTKGRAGYWWWPSAIAEGADITRPGGNRGRVFGTWKEPEPAMVAVHDPPQVPVVEPDPICAYPRVFVVGNVAFDFDNIVPTPEGRSEVDRVVAEMTRFGNDTLVCFGHTDDVGSAEYNLKLGERRAMAVKDYMVERGIEADRIAVKSMGEADPAVPNNSRPNRALNRRVAFEYTVGN